MSSPIKITVAFADEINRLPLSKKDVCTIVEQVCRGEALKHANISVVFVEAERMQNLNKRYLGREYPTDVLAFPLHNNGDPPEGEVYLCVDRAFRQAGDYRVPFREELARLVVHGTLHIIGYEDTEPGKRREMLEREERYLKKFLEIKNDCVDETFSSYRR